MKHSWTVVCSRSIVEQGSNQISLIGVVERMIIGRPEGLPDGIPNSPSLEEVAQSGQVVLVPVKLHIVSFWTRSSRDEPESGSARLKLIAPNGKLAAEAEMEVDLTNNINRRTVSKIDAFPFSGLGIYEVKIQMRPSADKRWRACAASYLEVVQGSNAPDKG